MANHDHAMGVPTAYYKHEHLVPRPRPLAEWRENYEREKKKLSEAWLQQVEWDTRIGGPEAGAKQRRFRQFHPTEAAKVRTESPWGYWDSLLQMAGLRPGIDLKQVIAYLSKFPIMGNPTLLSVYINCRGQLNTALTGMQAASWSDDFCEVLKLPDQTQLETIRILGEMNPEAPRLGYLPTGIYERLKKLGLAGMVADDPANATALLCWRSSLRAVGAQMGYHSLNKLNEDCVTPRLTGYETVIDVDEYGLQLDHSRGRLDALVVDDRGQGKLELKLEKQEANMVEVKLEKSGTGRVQTWLETSITGEQSLEGTHDESKALASLQHESNTGDQRRQPSQGVDGGPDGSDIEPELEMSDGSSVDSSESNDLVQRQDGIIKYQEGRILHLEATVKRQDDVVQRQDYILKGQESRLRLQESANTARKARRRRRDARHRALTRQLRARIKELAERNSALEQLLGSR